jgi:hypothetical protein
VNLQRYLAARRGKCDEEALIAPDGSLGLANQRLDQAALPSQLVERPDRDSHARGGHYAVALEPVGRVGPKDRLFALANELPDQEEGRHERACRTFLTVALTLQAEELSELSDRHPDSEMGRLTQTTNDKPKEQGRRAVG